MTALFRHLVVHLRPNAGYRLKLAWRILSGDWMYLPGDGLFRHEPAQALANISSEELRHRMPTLDSTSFADLERYLRVCRLLAIAEEHPELFGNTIVRGELFLTARERARAIRDQHRLRLAQARCKSQASSEVLLAHHGLKHEVPSAVYNYIRGKTFVDAGSFYGESSVAFLNYQPGFIHAFDPDPMTEHPFRSAMKQHGMSNYEYHPCALGNKKTSAEFRNVCRNRGAQAVSCNVTTLDEVFREQKESRLGVVSADIEGWGVELLEGGKEVITRDRPVLLLANYHNRNELFGMYKFLMEQNLDYTIKMRALCGGVFEMTMIAYPRELDSEPTKNRMYSL